MPTPDYCSLPDRLPRSVDVLWPAGKIRVLPGDFQVTEELSFVPNGDGPHCFLRLRKIGCNSAWLARRPADIAGCPERDIGYAGQKDRHAITEQWFRVPLSSHDWASGFPAGVELIEQTRNLRKLRRGALAGNYFRIRVREPDGPVGTLESTLTRLTSHGLAKEALLYL